MGNKGRWVAVGIASNGESIEVIRQRDWSSRGNRSAEAHEDVEDAVRRFKSRKDEQRALRAESRRLRESYGVAVR